MNEAVLSLIAVVVFYYVALFVREVRRDTIARRMRARERYRREVERNYHHDLEVPAFYRETAQTRRSRYIGRRPA